MTLVWDKQTLHGRTKSIPSYMDLLQTLKHLCLFFYTYPFVEKNPSIKGRNNAPRNNGLTDGVAQTQGEHLYRDDFEKKSCPHIHNSSSTYNKCQEGSEVVIDLTLIGKHQYD